MSNSKSKFKAAVKAKSNCKKSAPADEVWCVDICEHEVGWAIRLEDTFEFATKEEAEKYVQSENVKFAASGNSECYALAHAPYKKGAPKDPWIIN